jgi:hypothetical protein
MPFFKKCLLGNKSGEESSASKSSEELISSNTKEKSLEITFFDGNQRWILPPSSCRPVTNRIDDDVALNVLAFFKYDYAQSMEYLIGLTDGVSIDMKSSAKTLMHSETEKKIPSYFISKIMEAWNVDEFEAFYVAVKRCFYSIFP